VIGIGNVLMGDDAFGPYMIQLLDARYCFPQSVALLDLGTPSLDLVAHIRGMDALIILDAVRAEGQPGELRIYRRDELLKQPLQPRTDAHEPGLKEALLIAEFDGSGPLEACLIGVIPADTSTGVGLSSPVQRVLPEATEAVVRELEALGVIALQRSPVRTPQVWWEETPQLC
ncbi:MAG: hydrogenase maturation protease, partial [Pyrinomonadaceae bacterium]|nr:hydrogenase maturation protease [Pyrinomonadaceae bacterium]